MPVRRPLSDLGLRAPFRLRHLAKELQQLEESDSHSISDVNIGSLWTGNPPATILFQLTWDQRIVWRKRTAYFVLHLGRCTASLASTSSSPPLHVSEPHWAYISMHPLTVSTDVLLRDAHDCSSDHLCDWGLYTKVFDTRELGHIFGLQLSFTPCPLNPSGTFLAHLRILAHPNRDTDRVDDAMKTACTELNRDLDVLEPKLQLCLSGQNRPVSPEQPSDDLITQKARNFGNLFRSVRLRLSHKHSDLGVAHIVLTRSMLAYAQFKTV